MDLDAVCQVLVSNRVRADEAARMTPEVRRAATEAGLWLLVAPREVGGSELSLPELAAVFERLGEADLTFCWAAMNSTFTEFMGAFLAPDVAAQVLAGADGPFGVSNTPNQIQVTRVDGGWHVDGRFPFMTGADDARWCTALGLDANAPEAGIYTFVMPMTQLTLTETWVDATAMRGTGSNAVMASKVFVPDERVVSLALGPLIDRPLFRVSPWVVLFLPCAAMVIGALRAAMAGCVELVASKVSSMPDRTPYVEAGRVAQTLADAAATIECLSAGLRNVAEDMWAVAVDGQTPSTALRARWWSVLLYVMDAARQSVSDLYRSSGSAAYATRNSVQRSMQDIHAIATTFEQPFGSLLRSEAGRVLAGREPTNPVF